MAKKIDLRTYLALEKAFVRRLQRSWRQQSAPIYQKITQHCIDHQWDKARQLVPDLDMAEVGTQNREWITYMLLSFAVFGAGTVAKKKPSFVGVGSFDTFLKQVTNNILMYLEYSGTAQVQREALQSIAEDEAKTKALKREYVRDEKGQFAETVGKALIKAGRVTTDPNNTFFLLPNGTRVTAAGYNSHAKLAAAAGYNDLNKVIESGVVRYIPGVGIEANHLTETQARIIVEDWEAYFAGPKGWNAIQVDLIGREDRLVLGASSMSHRFDRLTVDALLNFVNRTTKWDESEHPRDVETGRFVEVTVSAHKKTKHGAYGREMARVTVEVPDVPTWETEAHAKAYPLLQDLFPKLKITTAIAGVKRIQKWDEAKHPRDKEGQFASSAGFTREERARMAHPPPIEGGYGPARGEWEERNREAMAAFDAFIDAKDAHRVHVDRMQKLHDGKPELWLDDKAYMASRAKLRDAERKRKAADEALARIEPVMRKEVVTNLANDVAEKMGIDPKVIRVVDKEPEGFKVGDKSFTEAGHYDPATRQIEINSRNLSYGDAPGVKGIVAHEISHLIYHTIKRASDREFQEFLSKAVTPDGQDHTDWFRERFVVTPKGRSVKPEYRDEIAREFPAATAMSTLSGGDIFTGISNDMIAENGHSEYAKSYWTPEARAARGHSYESAINESIAEVTRFITHPKGWYEMTKPSPNSPWVKLTKAMHEWYRERQDLLDAQRQAAIYAGQFR